MKENTGGLADGIAQLWLSGATVLMKHSKQRRWLVFGFTVYADMLAIGNFKFAKWPKLVYRVHPNYIITVLCSKFISNQ